MSIEDTATPTVPGADTHAGLPPPPAPVSGPSWPWIVGGVLAVLLAVGILFVAFARAASVGVDEYILAPGSATDSASSIIVDGAETFPPEGEIAFTTVSIRRNITIWEWFTSRFDDSSELVPAERIDGTRTTEETRQVTQFQMDVSQDTATLVALNYLGYELVPQVDGAFILEIVPDSPAQEGLQLGDLITDVNGTPIRSSEGLGQVIRSLAPGDPVDITLRRAGTDTGDDGSAPVTTTVEVTVVLAEHTDIEDAGFLGVRIETPVRADAPFEVGFDVGRVRGPSAGLAFSLAILDVLTEGELTGGMRVATTGTISVGGTVGPVGAVPQKIEAAKREGITLFLVPPTEYEDAIDAADGDIEVRCVQTFDDAVLVLVEFGGNGVAVAEARGAATPEASASLVDPNDGFVSCADVVGAA
ncbi:MAG: PDZ domain-containing protein [Acidimicrobiales bacterium]